MNLTTGMSYLLRNAVTRATARFTVHRLVEYGGQVIVLGVADRYGIHTGKSRLVMPGRMGFFVFLPTEKAAVTMWLSDRCKGFPLLLLDTPEAGSTLMGVSTAPEGVRAYPVLNGGSPGPFGGVVARSEAEMFKRAKAEIDEYRKFTTTGKFLGRMYPSGKGKNSIREVQNGTSLRGTTPSAGDGLQHPA